jgi:hypothetical protein
MGPGKCDRQQSEDRLGLSIPSSARVYLDERLIKLRETLDLTEALGKAGELPDVELSENGMKISPLEGDRPDGSEALNRPRLRALPFSGISFCTADT